MQQVPGPESPLVRVRDLHVVRGGSTVLDIPALEVPRGQVTAIVGPNGVGKTSLLLALAHLIPIARGEIFHDGKQVGRSITRAEVRRRLAAVFQEPLLLNRTVHENVAMGLRLRRVPRRQHEARIRPWLDALGIASLASRQADTLSGGQAQRTSLARALAVEPELLLLDEPFAALDAPTRRQLRHDFRALQQRLGTTTLLVTHDLGEAYLMADRIAVMDQGRILQAGPPEQVFDQPRDARVARLVGIENILPGTVVSATCVRIGDRDLTTPAHGLRVGTRAVVCARAERIRLVSGDTPPAGNLLTGQVIDEYSDGATVTLLFRLADERLLPHQSHDLRIDVPVYDRARQRPGDGRQRTAVMAIDILRVAPDDDTTATPDTRLGTG